MLPSLTEVSASSLISSILSFRDKEISKELGAQIIKDLKIKNMTLITKSPKKVIGLDGYGIKITKQEII